MSIGIKTLLFSLVSTSSPKETAIRTARRDTVSITTYHVCNTVRVAPEFSHNASVLDIHDAYAQVIADHCQIVVLNIKEQMRDGGRHFHGMLTLSGLDIPHLQKSIQ